MKTMENHKLYEKLTSEYPWLFEPANDNTISDETYLEYFKLKNCYWFPFVNYYKMEILNELKDKFVNFRNIAAQQGFAPRMLFQHSRDTHIHAFLVTYGDYKDHVIYLDFWTNKPKEFLECYNNFKKFEYTDENKALGFMAGAMPVNTNFK
jgi:hypothetical protein